MGVVAKSWVNQLLDGSPLDGVEVEGYLSALADGVNDIVNAQINANAGIAGSKLADNSVTGAKLTDNSITNAKMADNAIGTAEIVDQAVTQAKLQLYSGAGTGVGTGNIEDGAVTGAKLAAGTLGESSLLWAAAGGVKALHIGGAQKRLIYGVTTGLSAASGDHDVTVVFSTDAYDYVEDFSSTAGMVVGGGLFFASAPSTNTYSFVGPWFYSLATTGFSFRYRIEIGGGPVMSFHWWAIGDVS